MRNTLVSWVAVGVSVFATAACQSPGSEASAPQSLGTTGAIAGTVWKPLGPSPIIELGCCSTPRLAFEANGRVTSIAVDPTNASIVYLGSAGGGVWKSIDEGAHWRPLTDQEVSLGVGGAHAIAIDPNHPGTIYVGTSSYALLAQSQPRPLEAYQARGILASTDGGDSWIQLGAGVPTGNEGNAVATFTHRNITTIIVDPADSNALYVAAGRDGDAKGSEGGAYWSTDGGHNWTQGIGTEGMMVESLVLDASSAANARVLYAGAAGIGVLRSSDGGRHWTHVLDATTPAMANVGTFYKVMVALAPVADPPLADGPAIYASVMLGDHSHTLIFANTAGGAAASWVRKNTAILVAPNTSFDNLGGGPFSDMVVDPASPGDGAHDLVYWGGFTQFLSKSSGDLFEEIGQAHGLHGDHQTWLVVPHSGTNIVYAGDDGGIWRSEDQGASWTGTQLTSLTSTLNAGGLQIATLYQLAISQDALADELLGAAQDSGMLHTATGGGLFWSGTSNDGIDAVFDHVATDVCFGIQNTSFDRSDNGGLNWSTNFNASLPAGEIAIFENRLAIDPNNSGVLYVGGSQGEVFQSINAATWNVTPTFRSLGYVASGRYVSSIAVAPSDSTHVVVAANDGGINTVAVRTDAFAAEPDPWRIITANLPTRYTTRVAFDPNDANVVYATLAGYGGHVFRRALTDTGWTDISPAIDTSPVNAIAFDGSVNPAILYIGTDLGVLRRSVADGAAWTVVDGLHMPRTAVSDLEINETAGVLRAATWGRGVFELAEPTGPAIAVDPSQLAFGQTCATGGSLPIHVANIGNASLTVSSVQRRAGATEFTVAATPATPVALAAGESATFTALFTPGAGSARSAIIRIASSDPAVPHVDLVAVGRLETTAPVIGAVTATPNVLTPPNRKMVPVTVAVSVTDNCDTGVAASCHITAVTSNEPVTSATDNTSPDWNITGALTLNLRAERMGNMTGRTYTITVQCTDDAANTASASTTVTVPHL